MKKMTWPRFEPVPNTAKKTVFWILRTRVRAHKNLYLTFFVCIQVLHILSKTAFKSVQPFSRYTQKCQFLAQIVFCAFERALAQVDTGLWKNVIGIYFIEIARLVQKIQPKTHKNAKNGHFVVFSARACYARADQNVFPLWPVVKHACKWKPHVNRTNTFQDIPKNLQKIVFLVHLTFLAITRAARAIKKIATERIDLYIWPTICAKLVKIG